MKAILRAVDKFCYRHPRFGIPNLMIFIIAGNVAVFIIAQIVPSILNSLIFDAWYILHGQVWRLITFLFVPPSMAGGMLGFMLMLIMLFFYYFIGSSLEKLWGTGKFTIYYFSGALVLILFGFVMYFLSGNRAYNVSSSYNPLYFVVQMSYYLNMGMIFVFATFYPDVQVRLYMIIPAKVKYLAWLILVFFAIDVVGGFIGGSFPYNLMVFAILLHYLLFCGGWLIEALRPSRVRDARNAGNFRQAAKQVQREQERKPYTRRCEVCGKTDTDNPDLEFRYCSRCQGYHCFCGEHINNHTHFSE